MRSPLRPWTAETIGTAMLVAIGTGSIVAAGRLGGSPQSLLAVAWLLAVLLPMLLFLHRSGAHLNPAVTLALAASGRFPWRRAPLYWSAQLAGAFGGSAVVLALLGKGSELGATLVRPPGVGVAWVAEASFTILLIAAVFTLTDRGEGRHRWRVLLPPLAVGLSTYVIGPLTGSSLNPARTIAPAVLAAAFDGLWVYLTAVPSAALLVALVWKRPTAPGSRGGPGGPIPLSSGRPSSAPAAARTPGGAAPDGAGAPDGGSRPTGPRGSPLPPSGSKGTGTGPASTTCRRPG